MEIKVDFEDLVRIRERMGAPYKRFNIRGLDERDPEIQIVEQKLEKGIEIDPSEVERVGPFLTYKNLQAVLYIKDTHYTLYDIRHKKKEVNKFHIVWCRTLEEKKQNKTFENRYVMTRRTDGIFKVDAWSDETRTEKVEIEEKLYVCKNCLRHIDYKGSDKGNHINQVVKSFDIQEFLNEYHGVIVYLALPKGTDKTEPLARYTDQFVRRSRLVKEKAGYVCEECGVNLRNYRNLLHCHHKNHKKHDNGLNNLVAICALCHRDNHHKHLPLNKSDEAKIRELQQLPNSKIS